MKYLIRWTTWILITAALLTGCSSAALPVTGANQPASPSAPAQPNTAATQPALPTSTAAAAQSATQTAPQPAPAVPSTTAPAAAPALSCTSPAAVTPSLTEGPYFKGNSPERTSLLESGISGTRLTLTGYVLTTDCQPVAHALLDFWQANAQGQYDNNGYTLRGHQYTDASGRYTLETIIPGLYPGRTEHIHVKVQAPGGPVLTTQLFFPGQAENQTDQIFNPGLVLPIQTTGSGQTATFNFVVATH